MGRRRRPQSVRKGGQEARDTAGAVTHARLGASLRACAESARALGDAHRWRPAPTSASAENWRGTVGDARARTLSEADVQATMLMHSGLEHAAATGQLVSARRVFLPHSVARTAVEHLLRAQYLVDDGVDDQERIRRRLNEWLYAIVESDYRRSGLMRASVVAGGDLDPAELGRDKAQLLDEVAARASDVGEAITSSTKTPRVEGTTGRPSTMQLAEHYTAGGAEGIPSFTMRGHSAIAHGTETGILQCFADDAPADASLGGVIVPRPAAMPVSQTAFCMLGPLLSTVNATDAIRTRFEWSGDQRADRQHEQAKARALHIWSTALHEAEAL